jgi:tRNA modification GTPase
MPAPDDTIVALATPPGTGGVGVVRVSGGDTERIARAMVGCLPEPRVATVATFVDARGEPLDRGLALYFPAPASFTGESVLELHGHGGPIVMSLLVDAAVGLGARRAEPGEFTKRAFLNDKLDLAQAARAALRSLNGAFSEVVNDLAAQLTAIRVYVEAAIDFPEEEIDFLDDEELAERLARCAAAFEALLSTARIGRVMRDGYQVVIVGKPNAGKSSLMNRLSGEETAIVTEIAGTTRDVLRERINIDGLAVELVDTAGLRDNPGRIEEEGIRRARKALAEADAVLWIQDATEAVPDRIEESVLDDVPVTIVRNKIDLTGDRARFVEGGLPVVMLSARTGEGLEALRQHIRDLAGFRDLGESAFTARRRHVEALRDAQQRFEAGRAALRDARAGELLAEELRLAQRALSTITGEVTADDLLGRIFSEFCIGK